jgi:hypothetical protein
MPVLKIKTTECTKTGEFVFNGGKELSETAISEIVKAYLHLTGNVIYKVSDFSAHEIICLHLKRMDESFICGDKSVWEYLNVSKTFKNYSKIEDGRFKITIGNKFGMICDLPTKDTYAMFLIERGRLLPVCFNVLESYTCFILTSDSPIDYNGEDATPMIITTSDGDPIDYSIQIPKKEDNSVIIVDWQSSIKQFYTGVSNCDLAKLQKEENAQDTVGPVLGHLECSKL